MYPQVAERHEYVAFDLDGTLAEDTWPKPHIGKPIPEGIKMLKWYAEQGYCIVIYTARPSTHRDSIWRWLNEVGLAGLVYDVHTDKPIAGLYIDDRAWRFSQEAVVDIHKRGTGRVHNHTEECSLYYTGVCSCR